jgi:hypothetical protein
MILLPYYHHHYYFTLYFLSLRGPVVADARLTVRVFSIAREASHNLVWNHWSASRLVRRRRQGG